MWPIFDSLYDGEHICTNLRYIFGENCMRIMCIFAICEVAKFFLWQIKMFAKLWNFDVGVRDSTWIKSCENGFCGWKVREIWQFDTIKYLFSVNHHIYIILFIGIRISYMIWMCVSAASQCRYRLPDSLLSSSILFL